MLASIFHTNIFLRKISWYWSFNWRCFLYEICLNTERVPFGCYKSALPGTLLLTINTLEGVSTVSSNPVVLGPIGGGSYKGLQSSGFIIYRLNQNPGAPRPLDSTDHRCAWHQHRLVLHGSSLLQIWCECWRHILICGSSFGVLSQFTAWHSQETWSSGSPAWMETL